MMIKKCIDTKDDKIISEHKLKLNFCFITNIHYLIFN